MYFEAMAPNKQRFQISGYKCNCLSLKNGAQSPSIAKMAQARGKVSSVSSLVMDS
jgi:hypothetical protein